MGRATSALFVRRSTKVNRPLLRLHQSAGCARCWREGELRSRRHDGRRSGQARGRDENTIICASSTKLSSVTNRISAAGTLTLQAHQEFK